MAQWGAFDSHHGYLLFLFVAPISRGDNMEPTAANATIRPPKASALWLGNPRGLPPPDVPFRPACIVPVWFLPRPTHNLCEAKLAVIYHP